jgi:2-oxoglutarate ferredoxin oxidoreductase subunit gamma
MHEEIIISGFGGQGVLFAGQLLAYAAVAENLHVTWIPSYGPEMRGGTAHCQVIISSEEIGSPLTASPTVVVALNNPSMEKYEPVVRPGGFLIIDSSLVPTHTNRLDIHEIALPAKEIASDLGLPQAANVVILGALCAATGAISLDTLEHVLEAHLGERHRHTLGTNIRALHLGAEFITSTRNKTPVAIS